MVEYLKVVELEEEGHIGETVEEDGLDEHGDKVEVPYLKVVELEEEGHIGETIEEDGLDEACDEVEVLYLKVVELEEEGHVGETVEQDGLDEHCDKVKVLYLKVVELEEECHVGETVEQDGLDKHCDEVEDPAPLEDGHHTRHPVQICTWLSVQANLQFSLMKTGFTSHKNIYVPSDRPYSRDSLEKGLCHNICHRWKSQRIKIHIRL